MVHDALRDTTCNGSATAAVIRTLAEARAAIVFPPTNATDGHASQSVECASQYTLLSANLSNMGSGRNE